jgi:glucokinase
LCNTHPPETAWREIVRITRDAVLDALRDYPQATAIGIGFPGFVDPISGNIAQSPNLPGLSDVDLAKALTQLLARPVIVENDALAAAYGEFRLGEYSGGNLIYLGLGTGVGGGLIVGGKPFTGRHGYAMEVGHIIVAPAGNADSRLCGCGNHGCMERYASASGVSLSYELATGSALSSSKIAALAQANNKEAAHAYHLAGTALAQALAHIAKVVDIGERGLAPDASCIRTAA